MLCLALPFLPDSSTGAVIPAYQTELKLPSALHVSQQKDLEKDMGLPL